MKFLLLLGERVGDVYLWGIWVLLAQTDKQPILCLRLIQTPVVLDGSIPSHTIVQFV